MKQVTFVHEKAISAPSCLSTAGDKGSPGILQGHVQQAQRGQGRAPAGNTESHPHRGMLSSQTPAFLTCLWDTCAQTLTSPVQAPSICFSHPPSLFFSLQLDCCGLAGGVEQFISDICPKKDVLSTITLKVSLRTRLRCPCPVLWTSPVMAD